VVLVLASQQSQLTLFTGVLALGLLIGVFGHIIHSTPLILTGILVIGLVSGYFAFVLQPGSGG
jgi:F0F1-type ATP synthase assembly protein I